MFDEMRTRVVEWPRFEGNEMRDLAAYLRSRVQVRPATRPQPR